MDLYQERYDAVPYQGRPCRFTDPARLEALAHLWGLDPAPAHCASVLELGGGDGGNIIPMAARAPGGRFLCIDVSGRAVSRGRSRAEALGLDHLEIRHQAIEDLPEDEGPWDYIVAHGVWSWVSPTARRCLLEICGRQLAPHGVAYVSYNTKPGWLQRDAVRQMMLQHTRDLEDLGHAAHEAGALLDLLVESQPPGDSVWKAMLTEERQLVRDHGLDYLAHEYLSPDNEAMWFHELVERAAAVGLQYLGEANPAHQYLALHDPGVEAALDRVATARLHRESIMDWVRGRMFRKTLLCRQGLPLRSEVRFADLEPYWLSAKIEPLAARPELADGVEQVFQGRGGEIGSSSALVKAVLWTLGMAGSADLRLDELWGGVVDLLGREGLSARDEDRLAVAEGMLEWWKRGEIDLVRAARPTSGVTLRPRASSLSRHCAGDDVVTNARHETVFLRPTGRRLLPLLDGTRSRDALLAALMGLAARGELGVTSRGAPVTDSDALGAALEQVLDRELAYLARLGLLEA